MVGTCLHQVKLAKRFRTIDSICTGHKLSCRPALSKWATNLGDTLIFCIKYCLTVLPEHYHTLCHSSFPPWLVHPDIRALQTVG